MSRHRPGSTATRRRYLALAAVIGGSLAGCLGGGDGSDTEEAGTTATEGPGSTAADGITTNATPTADTNATAGAETTTTAATGSAAQTTTGGQLDLREANVVGVEIESTDGGYRFDVTLYHDDDGEDGYANWWQVETLGGERLGRRKLRHPHGTTRFTRSETIEMSSETARVVRGHDQTHGYGGQAMLVTLETGATEIVRQGSEPQSFGSNDSDVGKHDQRRMTRTHE